MAIILGGAVGVGFVVILLMFARNLLKKHDGKYLFLLTIHLFVCFVASSDDGLVAELVLFLCRLLIKEDGFKLLVEVDSFFLFVYGKFFCFRGQKLVDRWGMKVRTLEG